MRDPPRGCPPPCRPGTDTQRAGHTWPAQCPQCRWLGIYLPGDFLEEIRGNCPRQLPPELGSCSTLRRAFSPLPMPPVPLGPPASSL